MNKTKKASPKEYKIKPKEYIVSDKNIKRKDIKYPGLEAKRAPVIRREELYCDYLNKLSPDEKAWLSQFNDEEVNANVPKKETNPEGHSKLLDKSDENRKKIFGNNNRRNRDILAISKVMRTVTSVESDAHLSHFVDKENSNYNHHEDTVLCILDEKRKTDKN